MNKRERGDEEERRKKKERCSRGSIGGLLTTLFSRFSIGMKEQGGAFALKRTVLGKRRRKRKRNITRRAVSHTLFNEPDERETQEVST